MAENEPRVVSPLDAALRKVVAAENAYEDALLAYRRVETALRKADEANQAAKREFEQTLKAEKRAAREKMALSEASQP